MQKIMHAFFLITFLSISASPQARLCTDGNCAGKDKVKKTVSIRRPSPSEKGGVSKSAPAKTLAASSPSNNLWSGSRYGYTQNVLENEFNVAWTRLTPHREEINRAAKKYGVPVEILYGSIIQESKGQGDLGQFKPDTWAKECKGFQKNAVGQINCKAKYIKKLAGNFQGAKGRDKFRLGILSYNLGHANVLEARQAVKSSCKVKTLPTADTLLSYENNSAQCPQAREKVLEAMTPGKNNGFKHLRLVDFYASLASRKLNILIAKN